MGLFTSVASGFTPPGAAPAPTPVQAVAQPQQAPAASGGAMDWNNLSSLVPDYQKYAYSNPYGLLDYGNAEKQMVNIGGKQYVLEDADPSGRGADAGFRLYDPTDPHKGANVYNPDGSFRNVAPYNDGNAKANFGMFLLSAGTMGAAGMMGGAGSAAEGLGSAGLAGDATAAGYAGLDAAGASTLGGGASVAGGSSLAGGAVGASGAAAAGAGAAGGSSTPWYQQVGKALGVPGMSGSTGGGMDWTSLISPGANLVGGYLNSKASSDAAQKASDSTLAAAQIAADAAKFRPVGVTSRFGSSGFQYDANGNLVGAGYNLSPDAAAYRDRMMAGASGDMAAADQASGAAQGMFRLGSQYLSGDPAGDWMRAQQNLLAPSRERQLAGVRSNLFATGRTGLAVGGTGARPDGSAGLGASNPEMEAYFNAIAQQDAGLATQAQQQGRDAVTFGSGLFSNGMNLLNTRYSPALASIGGANTIEGLGQSTLDMGAQLGGRGASAGAASGALLAAGARSAAPYQYQANSQSPAGNFFAGVGSNPSAATNLYSNIQGLWSGGSPQPSPYASWQTAGNGMPPGYDS